MAKIEDIIAANLRRHRKLRLKLTQAQAAELCKVPQRTYQRAEDGETSSVPTLEAIARGFGIDSAALYQDVKYLPKPTPEDALEILRAAIEAKSAVEIPEDRRELVRTLIDLPPDQFKMASELLGDFLADLQSRSEPPADKGKRRV